MSRIIVFDANDTTISLIEYAKKQGHYVISCDNKPNNEGHKYANENLFVSTYDIDNIKRYLQKNNVDAAVFFTSAHGVYAASNLSDMFTYSNLNKEMMEKLSDKHTFRTLLRNNGINCPDFYVATACTDFLETQICYPVIVKPVDRGGNVGITKVMNQEELKDALAIALDKSMKKIAVVETFIETDLQVNGDCVVFDGKVKFAFLGRHIYANKTSIVPYSTMFGAGIISEDCEREIIAQIECIIEQIGMKNGILNVEFRVGLDGKVYCIEINTRHSGNRIYELMTEASGISMSNIAVDLSLNKNISKYSFKKDNNCYAYVILYSDIAGSLEDIWISSELDEYILSKYIFKNKGDLVNNFKCLSDRVGLINFKFPNREIMENIVYNIKDYYCIKVKEK